MNDTQTVLVPEADAHHPGSLNAFHTVKLLLGGYLALSVLTMVAVYLLRDDAAAVNPAVWIRSTIVVASAIVNYTAAARAARGSRGAYRRLRIVSGVMVGAIAVIIALPGSFPLWMKLEQGVCGLLLLGVVAIINRRQLRSRFASA